MRKDTAPGRKQWLVMSPPVARNSAEFAGRCSVTCGKERFIHSGTNCPGTLGPWNVFCALLQAIPLNNCVWNLTIACSLSR